MAMRNSQYELARSKTITTTCNQDSESEADSNPDDDWDSDEDDILRTAVELHGGKRWKAIATCLSSRSPSQCRERWKQLRGAPPGRKIPWTAAEDAKLTELVGIHGAKRWALIASNVPGRNEKQCRTRWVNQLNPEIKPGDWTAEEDARIAELQAQYGNAWAKIAEQLPRRTENGVKNRWYSNIFKSVRKTQSSGQKRKRVERTTPEKKEESPSETPHDPRHHQAAGVLFSLQNEMQLLDENPSRSPDYLNVSLKSSADVELRRSWKHIQELEPLFAKMNHFEMNLQEAKHTGGDDLEQLWEQYLDFARDKLIPMLGGNANDQILLTCLYERAVAMVPLSVALWRKYIVDAGALPAGSHGRFHKLWTCERATVNIASESKFWVDLLLEMELQQIPLVDIREYVTARLLTRTDHPIMDHANYARVLTIYCDIHRRAAQMAGYTESAIHRLDDAFAPCVSFLNTHFPETPECTIQLLEYQAKCCIVPAKARESLDRWNSIWQIILAKAGHHAATWIRYYEECVRVGAKSIAEIRTSVFQRALEAVKDDRVAVMEAFVAFERQYGTIKNY